MKRIISLLLVFALCGTICVLSACEPEGVSLEITNPPDFPDVITEAREPSGTDGGWEVNADAAEADMPQEAKDAFDEAMNELVGAIYTPIAYLGSQVVAGTNYAYLCKTELTTADPVTMLSLVTIYCDLQGNASIRNIADINIAAYTDNEDLDFGGPLAGGWAHTADYPAVLDEEDQATFDAATNGLTGASYTPLALMGTQVVGGRSLAFLCSATNAAPEPETLLAVVIVYAALDGTATVTSIAPFTYG